MSQTAEVTPTQKELLIHMLGAGKHVRRGQDGYRNYFCAAIVESDGDYQEMLAMQEAGLVRAGGKINNGTMQYFIATLEGCKAAGLSKAATKRALDDK